MFLALNFTVIADWVPCHHMAWKIDVCQPSGWRSSMIDEMESPRDEDSPLSPWAARKSSPPQGRPPLLAAAAAAACCCTCYCACSCCACCCCMLCACSCCACCWSCHCACCCCMLRAVTAAACCLLLLQAVVLARSQDRPIPRVGQILGCTDLGRQSNLGQV